MALVEKQEEVLVVKLEKVDIQHNYMESRMVNSDDNSSQETRFDLKANKAEH